MRKFLISAAIIGLVGGTSLAMAQDHDRQGGPGGGNAPHAGSGEHPGGGAPHPAGPGGNPRPAPAPHAAPAPNPAAAAGRNAIGQREMREHHDTPAVTPAVQPAPEAAPNATRGNNNNARGSNNAPNNAVRVNPGRQDNNNRPNFNNNNRPNSNNANRGGQRHDFSSARNFHQNFRAQQRFHAPSYRRPPGYYARRWTWGQVLPNFFWTRDYWLTDYNDYDLPPPPFGATWVRVGDDALLIDQDSGEIIEVDYGVFY